MNSTLTAVLQSDRGLKVNEVYWITTSHERQRDYIYEGVNDEIHIFFRDGAVRDSMRRITVHSENLLIQGKDVKIINDAYELEGVDKDEEPEEYSRLQTLWRSKEAR